MNIREAVKDKKRIVIKIGSSSLMHNETGRLNLGKIEKLVRTIVDIKNSGKDVVLVSSGAIAVGRMAIGLNGVCGYWTGKAYDGISEDIC